MCASGSWGAGKRTEEPPPPLNQPATDLPRSRRFTRSRFILWVLSQPPGVATGQEEMEHAALVPTNDDLPHLEGGGPVPLMTAKQE